MHCRNRTFKSPPGKSGSNLPRRDRHTRSACAQWAGSPKPSEFENIILKTGTDGTLVRLKDVGHAELGAEDYGSILRFNGHDAVGLAVTQLPGANALDVDKAAKQNCCGSPRIFLQA